MPCMSTPTVIENRAALEPVAADPFVADLDTASSERDARLAALFAGAAAIPRRRIYD
jgi:hypothetical protein